MLCWTGAAPEIYNSILWGNSASSSPGIYNSSANPLISYSNIQGGWSGTGNISSDPKFIFPTQKDLHISYASPCRDVGLNSVIGLPSWDVEGDPRLAYGVADMGADEFYPHLYYTGDATSGENVVLKFIGIPDDTVRLWIGSGVLDPFLHHPLYGNWYLEAPILLGMIMGMVPSPDGVYVLPVAIPPDYVPWDIPLQAGIGVQFSNLCVMKVE